MKYREMQPADVAQVLEVRISTHENAMTMESLAALGVTPASVVGTLRGNSKGWVCEDSGRIVGFTMGNGATGEMLVAAVLPELEGHGIGRRLMELVQDWLFSQGHQELWLLENPDPAIRAHGFYRNLGWSPTGQYRDGEQILKLFKPA